MFALNAIPAKWHSAHANALLDRESLAVHVTSAHQNNLIGSGMQTQLGSLPDHIVKPMHSYHATHPCKNLHGSGHVMLESLPLVRRSPLILVLDV